MASLRRSILAFSLAVATLFLILQAPSCCGAAQFPNTLSMQGFTGLLNTPSAQLVEEGTLSFSYSDQTNPEWRRSTSRADSYFFTTGFFSFLELGGRLTDAPGVMRDLSASVKLKVPFIPQGLYLPELAIGAVDEGGTARFRTRYVVATETLWRLRGSVGYGTGPNLMKGIFGGVEFKAHDWVYLLAEHDTLMPNAGIKVVTPEFFGVPVRLQLTAKTSLEHGPKKFDLAFAVNFPLSFKSSGPEKKGEEPGPGPAGSADPARERAEAAIPAAQPSASPEQDGAAVPPGKRVVTGQAAVNSRHPSLTALRKALTGQGLQDVEVGVQNERDLVIIYENNVFNHNELDALGVVLGFAAAAGGGEELRRVLVVMQRKGIRVLEVAAPLDDLRAFFAGKESGLEGSLEVAAPSLDDRSVDFVEGKKNGIYFKPALVIWPGLTTFVGTEAGAFDYLLSIKAELLVNFWKGGVTDLRWDFPVSWSRNLEDGRVFRDSRRGSRLERAMQFQAFKLSPSVFGLVGAGKLINDTYGTLNELIWSSAGGGHRLRFKQAYGEDAATRERREVYLGSYRYYFGPLDLFAEGTGGRFWGQDIGASLELKRLFGDTSLTAFYKNSRTSRGRHLQSGGMQISFPLTLRKDMKPVLAQVRGTEEWSYTQETVIFSGRNSILMSPVGTDPQTSVNLETTFFNRDRLNRRYILSHLHRLFEAYARFKAR
ncbi:MAG: hypothetical protein A2075_16550 [Geobacteraceae bacterium GWC2_58_44]|nr:MAG: hypothetical protein A2075_16550 [Geobacteraceae bacterium GWC2_58_44]HBG05060.1 hypothetical protein [Geobacter sp.]